MSSGPLQVPTLFDPTFDELSALLGGEPRYRTEQVWKGLYEQLAEPANITNIPAALRERLTAELPPALEEATRSTSDGGDTVKVLWNLRDGTQVESVLMHQQGPKSEWSTVCISTQAGCAMGCGFCATGQMGLERNLTVGEIVEQVIWAAREARPRRLSNVVFMGMGEPLANYSRTWASVERMHGAIGLSARKLTVSTVGIAPAIERMAGEGLPVNLAVSLHAANDGLRDELAPINKRYPIARLVEACQAYIDAHNRRLSFEWAMIDGVNDRDQDARELADVARGLRAHVNLIPLNRTPGYPTQGTPPARIKEFKRLLDRLEVNATIRKTRGNDIDAACGQLRAEQEVHILPLERPTPPVEQAE